MMGDLTRNCFASNLLTDKKYLYFSVNETRKRKYVNKSALAVLEGDSAVLVQSETSSFPTSCLKAKLSLAYRGYGFILSVQQT